MKEQAEIFVCPKCGAVLTEATGIGCGDDGCNPVKVLICPKCRYFDVPKTGKPIRFK